ncbi:MAG: DNA polymerase IV [Clostridia bacterium]|nr:DNA polymerase IV [Clostridia bacterium]
MDRVILHCDLNNFFASATLAGNPTLKTLPVAICGDAKKRHGIVLAKNTVAKSFGVLTAETIWEAKRKCPDLVTLPPNYKLYEELSKKVQKIYLDFSDRVEPFGIDECWVEITNPNMTLALGEEIANKIRNRVKNECGVTVSVGVSFTKTLAKLGSDIKKPDAVTVIDKSYLKNVIYKRPCSDLLLVGRSPAKTLKSMGIFTIGDLAAANETALIGKLGKNGQTLIKMARGEDTEAVKSYFEHEKPKSIGHSATAENDLTEEGEVFAAFIEFSEGICYKLRKENLLAGTVAIHTLTGDFEGREYRTPLEAPTDLSMTIAKAAMELFKKNNCLSVPLRAVGVRVVNLTEKTDAMQLSLFENADEIKAEQNLEKEILDIRNKYGDNSLKRAVCINNKAKPSSPGFYKK